MELRNEFWKKATERFLGKNPLSTDKEKLERTKAWTLRGKTNFDEVEFDSRESHTKRWPEKDMKKQTEINELEWRILCTACGENPWYFNVANLHYKWNTGSQTPSARRRWYKHLASLCELGFISAYLDQYKESLEDPNLMDAIYEKTDKIDFRRRMSFRATRKGWSAYRKYIQSGMKRPQ